MSSPKPIILYRGKDEPRWWEKIIFALQALEPFLLHKATRFKWDRSVESVNNRWSITLGNRIWLSKGLSRRDQETTVAHELVHYGQIERIPLPFFWLRTLAFYITYLLFPLPVLITQRAAWEFEAYLEEARARWAQGRTAYPQELFYMNVKRIFRSSYFYMDSLGWSSNLYCLDFEKLLKASEPSRKLHKARELLDDDAAK